MLSNTAAAGTSMAQTHTQSRCSPVSTRVIGDTADLHLDSRECLNACALVQSRHTTTRNRIQLAKWPTGKEELMHFKLYLPRRQGQEGFEAPFSACRLHPHPIRASQRRFGSGPPSSKRPPHSSSWFLVGNGGMGYGDYYWGLL